jgi:phosphoribosylamine-glycine ligase
MIYVFFHYEHYPLPLAKHLQDEGNKVIVGTIKSKKSMKIFGDEDTEKPEQKEMRLSCFDGIIDKKPHDEVLKYLENAKDKDDHFIFFDYNDMFVIAEDVIKMGFKNGLFPTAFYYKLESERELAKEIVQNYFPDLRVAEYQSFQKAQEGIDFINKSKKILVLKSNGKSGDTIVPKTEDLKIAKEELVHILNKNKKLYEERGFLLEEMISDCLEVAPVIVFYNGEPVYSLAEFENKEFGSGNIGPLKGGNQAVSLKTSLDCQLNKIAFPEFVYKLAKQHPGMSVYDAGLLWNGKEFYFTEFCGMRFGWDGIISEIVMRDNHKKDNPYVANYFQDVMKKKNPLINNYGVSVRLFNYAGMTHTSNVPQSGLPIRFDEGINNNLFWYRVKMEDEHLVTIGDQDFIGAVAGSGDDLETSSKIAYDFVSKIDFQTLYYRPRFDMLSDEYKTSIPKRIKAVEKFL